MDANVERFSGFAQQYDQFRPQPPLVLRTVLLGLAKIDLPELVVDLGSGTGLSTVFWKGFARRVVGVEPNRDMYAYANALPRDSSIQFVQASSNHTTLADSSADIVTCSQSLHWMEPQSTFKEVGRILRSGGVFAAYDCDWPPTTGVWLADDAYSRCMQTVNERERSLAGQTKVAAWPKEQHLQRMRDSGVFRFVKEIAMHHIEKGNADRLVGVLMSKGSVQALLKAGLDEEQLGISSFKREAQELLGTEDREWYWTYRVRIGIA